MPKDFDVMLGGKTYTIQSITEDVVNQREY